jgi:hypothetical protein
MFPLVSKADETAYGDQTGQDQHDQTHAAGRATQTSPPGASGRQTSGGRKTPLAWDRKQLIVNHALQYPGESLRKIASCFNTNHGTVQRILRESGIYTHVAPHRVTPYERARVAQFAWTNPGTSRREIAERFNRSPNTIGRIIDAARTREALPAAFGSARLQQLAAALQTAPAALPSTPDPSASGVTTAQHRAQPDEPDRGMLHTHGNAPPYRATRRWPLPSGEAVERADAPLDLSVRRSERGASPGNAPAARPMVQDHGVHPDVAPPPEEHAARPSPAVFWRPW